MQTNYRAALDCAIETALCAGANLRKAFHGASHEREDYDTPTEREIYRSLKTAFPNYGFHGEELHLVDSPGDEERHLWLVDPNDGTSSFQKGGRGASVSIALLRDGRPVLGVVYAYAAPDDNGDLFTWAEGLGPVQRNRQPLTRDAASIPETILLSQDADKNPAANARLAAPHRYRAVVSIAYRLALVAAGEALAAVSTNSPVGWDYAGGHALLLGAGLDLYDGEGQPIRYAADGNSDCGGRCYGGAEAIAAELATRDWSAVHRRRGSAVPRYPLLEFARGRTVPDAAVLARAQGCLLGQLAGDSLGGLVEFRRAADIECQYPRGVRELTDGGVWRILAGQPTDDSEMALLLARSIIVSEGYDEEAAAQAYGRWYDSHPFDIGTTTRAAVQAASQAIRTGQPVAAAARNAALSHSQSNGALMRVSPLAIFVAGRKAGEGGEWAMQDTGLSHPHPVCRHASRIFVETTAFAIRSGACRQEIYDFALLAAQTAATPEAVTLAIAKAAHERPADYGTNQGWVLIALQNAFWQLRHAENAEEGIVDTVMAGGDTDTNGAIAGALLGAAFGRDAIPWQWQERVLTCRPIDGIPGVDTPRPEWFWPVDALRLAERLLALGRQG